MEVGASKDDPMIDGGGFQGKGDTGPGMQPDPLAGNLAGNSMLMAHFRLFTFLIRYG
jgi:hypothetical protein